MAVNVLMTYFTTLSG